MSQTEMLKLATLKTCGKGLWSDVAKEVIITGLQEVEEWSELRVFFDTTTWDVEQDGLIYTDPTFLTGLRELLKDIGFERTVGYSEQGMQGLNYVSLDIY